MRQLKALMMTCGVVLGLGATGCSRENEAPRTVEPTGSMGTTGPTGTGTGSMGTTGAGSTTDGAGGMGAGSGTGSATGPTGTGTMGTGPAGTATASGTMPQIGVASCDEYFQKMSTCMSKMAPEVRTSVERAMTQNREAWANAAANADSRNTLESTCRQMIETARTSYQSAGCEF